MFAHFPTSEISLLVSDSSSVSAPPLSQELSHQSESANAASSTWSLDKTAGTWRLIEEWIGESPTPPANPACPWLPVLCLAGISPQTGRRSWVNKPSNPPRSCQIYCRNLWSVQSKWLTGPKWLVMTRTTGKRIKGVLKCFMKWKYISRTITELSGIFCLSTKCYVNLTMQLDCWGFKPEIYYIHLASLQERVFSVALSFLKPISFLLAVTSASCPYKTFRKGQKTNRGRNGEPRCCCWRDELQLQHSLHFYQKLDGSFTFRGD